MSSSDQAGGDGSASAGPERIALHTEDRRAQRVRLWGGVVLAGLLAAAFGGIASLLGGGTVGAIVAAIVGLGLLYPVLRQARRGLWLEGSTVLLRRFGTRRVDLREARRIDVLVMELRGTRAVGLLINADQRRRSVRIDLAVYAGDRGREMEILALRTLADALMNNTEANGMVFGELLVAQLRSEAREEPPGARPLYQLAAQAQPGKLAQRIPMEAVRGRLRTCGAEATE